MLQGGHSMCEGRSCGSHARAGPWAHPRPLSGPDERPGGGRAVLPPRPGFQYGEHGLASKGHSVRLFALPAEGPGPE